MKEKKRKIIELLFILSLLLSCSGHTSGEVQFTLILLNQNLIVETVINMI